MNAVKELQEAVTRAVTDLPEADRELAQAVARDAADLTARALLGQVVTDELKHVQAAAVALSAAAKVRVEGAIRDSIASIVGTILRAAIAGA